MAAVSSTTLDLSNLTSLDLRGCKLLQTIQGMPTALTSLQIDGCTALNTLDIRDTHIRFIDIPPTLLSTLKYFDIRSTPLAMSGVVSYNIPTGGQWFLY